MSEHSEFLERRRKYIGSSDIGAILGVNKWRNARDVYLDKVFGKDPALDRDSGGDDNDAIWFGKTVETDLVRYGAERVGVELLPTTDLNSPYSHENTKGNCGCQHDGLSKDRTQGFEAKTAGIVYAHIKGDEWGDELTDQIPHSYLLQATHQLYVSDLEVVHVPALVGGRGRLLFRVNRNEDLIKVVAGTAEEFWQKYIARQIEPPETEPAHMPLLKALKRTPEKTVEIDSFDVQIWLQYSEARKQAQKAEDEAKRQIIDALGDAEAGISHRKDADTGEVETTTVTYFLQKGADSIDRKMLKAQFPEVYEQVTNPNTYRVLRKKKGQK